MHVLVALTTPEYIAYADAARLLQHALGVKAPELPALLAMEFRHRSGKTIAEEYLERHGHPCLRRCVRERRKERKAVPGKRVPGRTRVGRPKVISIVDPTLN